MKRRRQFEKFLWRECLLLPPCDTGHRGGNSEIAAAGCYFHIFPPDDRNKSLALPSPGPLSRLFSWALMVLMWVRTTSSLVVSVVQTLTWPDMYKSKICSFLEPTLRWRVSWVQWPRGCLLILMFPFIININSCNEAAQFIILLQALIFESINIWQIYGLRNNRLTKVFCFSLSQKCGLRCCSFRAVRRWHVGCEGVEQHL